MVEVQEDDAMHDLLVNVHRRDRHDVSRSLTFAEGSLLFLRLADVGVARLRGRSCRRTIFVAFEDRVPGRVTNDVERLVEDFEREVVNRRVVRGLIPLRDGVGDSTKALSQAFAGEESAELERVVNNIEAVRGVQAPKGWRAGDISTSFDGVEGPPSRGFLSVGIEGRVGYSLRFLNAFHVEVVVRRVVIEGPGSDNFIMFKERDLLAAEGNSGAGLDRADTVNERGDVGRELPGCVGRGGTDDLLDVSEVRVSLVVQDGVHGKEAIVSNEVNKPVDEDDVVVVGEGLGTKFTMQFADQGTEDVAEHLVHDGDFKRLKMVHHFPVVAIFGDEPRGDELGGDGGHLGAGDRGGGDRGGSSDGWDGGLGSAGSGGTHFEKLEKNGGKAV